MLPAKIYFAPGSGLLGDGAGCGPALTHSLTHP